MLFHYTHSQNMPSFARQNYDKCFLNALPCYRLPWAFACHGMLHVTVGKISDVIEQDRVDIYTLPIKTIRS